MPPILRFQSTSNICLPLIPFFRSPNKTCQNHSPQQARAAYISKGSWITRNRTTPSPRLAYSDCINACWSIDSSASHFAPFLSNLWTNIRRHPVPRYKVHTRVGGAAFCSCWTWQSKWLYLLIARQRLRPARDGDRSIKEYSPFNHSLFILGAPSAENTQVPPNDTHRGMEGLRLLQLLNWGHTRAKSISNLQLEEPTNQAEILASKGSKTVFSADGYSIKMMLELIKKTYLAARWSGECGILASFSLHKRNLMERL